MPAQFNGGLALQYASAAYLLISGNASGTTPKLSAWTLVDAESLTVTLATGSGTNCVWSAQVSDYPDGREVIDLPDPPTFPTGVNHSQAVVITMPSGYRYLRLKAVPSAGSSSITATPTLVTGRPFRTHHAKLLGLSFHCDAAATLVGQAAWEMSPNYSPRQQQIGSMPVNSAADPALWVPGIDADGNASTVAAKLASTAQDVPIRLGHWEYPAVRAKLTITSGFGAGLGYRVFVEAKA